MFVSLSCAQFRTSLTLCIFSVSHNEQPREHGPYHLPAGLGWIKMVTLKSRRNWLLGASCNDALQLFCFLGQVHVSFEFGRFTLQPNVDHFVMLGHQGGRWMANPKWVTPEGCWGGGGESVSSSGDTGVLLASISSSARGVWRIHTSALSL